MSIRPPVALLIALCVPLALTGCGVPVPAPSSHDRMVALLDEIRVESLRSHPYFGTATAESLQSRLDALADGEPGVEHWNLHVQIGLQDLRQGNEEEGLRSLARAYGMLHDLRRDLGPEATNNLILLLGVGSLRLGETQNCCERNAPEACILPLRGAGLHAHPAGSTQAIRFFEEVLGRPRASRQQQLIAAWLLNIAHMTLGTYPEGIPEAYRVPEEVLEPDGAPFPRFENIAGSLGLDTFSLSGSVIIDDFDGDDDLDVVASTWDVAGPLRFFRNEGDGTFSDRSAEAGLTGIVSGLNLVQADYDNDGALDVLVLRGAWGGTWGRHPNSLLRNDGSGTFRDVTFDAGLGDVHWPSSSAAWFDLDSDGDLDLYVGNETTHGLRAPCQLFRNEGDGTFTDIAGPSGVENLGFSKAIAAGDYDGDSDPDLYVSNYNGPNRLYRNDGSGAFTDVAAAAGVDGPRESFPAWFWDYDNDGNLDLFAASYTGRIWNHMAHLLGASSFGERDRLYRGDGAGGFEDRTESAGLGFPTLPMGASFGDLDNDGFPEIYLGTGDPDYMSILPNVMLKNEGGRTFRDVTMAGGFGHLQKGHGIAFADLDADGDLDVFEQMGGAYPGDGFFDALYENPGFGNHWLGVQLIGTESNRSAIGARIRADFVENGAARSVYRSVNSGGSFGASPLRQTIGVGSAPVIRELEIRWPASGIVQRFRDVAVDRVLRITEGQDRLETVTIPRVGLGGLTRAAASPSVPASDGG